MLVHPIKTLFGVKLQTSIRDTKVKPEDFDYTTSWKPFVDKKSLKVGFNSIGTRKSTIAANYVSFDVIDKDIIVTIDDKKKYGLINQQGLVFDSAFDSFESYGIIGMIGVKDKDAQSMNYGLINLEQGSVLVTPKKALIEPIYDPRIRKYTYFKITDKDKNVSLINREGKTIVPPTPYGYNEVYLNDKTYFTYKNEMGKSVLATAQGSPIISTQGNIMVDRDIVLVNSLAGTTVYVAQDNRLGVLLETHENLSYLGMADNREPEYLFKLRDQKTNNCCIVNQHMNAKTMMEYQDIVDFDCDYFMVVKNNLKGLMSKNTYHTCLGCQFQDILPMYGRDTFAQKDNLWGVLGAGPDFETKIPFAYKKSKIVPKTRSLYGTTADGTKEIVIDLGKGSYHSVTEYNQDEINKYSYDSSLSKKG